jgi:hypothetical protein
VAPVVGRQDFSRDGVSGGVCACVHMYISLAVGRNPYFYDTIIPRNARKVKGKKLDLLGLISGKAKPDFFSTEN